MVNDTDVVFVFKNKAGGNKDWSGSGGQRVAHVDWTD